MSHPALSESDIVNLVVLRGSFHQGHTAEDAGSVLAEFQKLTGITLAVLWAFNDRWGLGGDSELAMVRADGVVCEAPGAICEFLYKPGNIVDASSLAGLGAGGPVKNGHSLFQFGSFNYAWRDEPNEELG